jgi:acyl-CoA synthetase (AMP-forming)/AMP-acid ligase II
MLADTIREAARRFGDQPAFTASTGWTLSFAELDHASDEVAVGLASRGVAEGDAIALALASSPEYPVAYAAAAKLGAITVGLNPRATALEREAMLELVAPALVLATDDRTDGVPTGQRVEPVASAEAPADILAGLRRAHRDESPSSLAADPERPVAIVLTSGTTGRPKGAVFAGRQLDAVVQADTGGRWGRGAPMLAGTELAHVGFMTKLPWYLRTGATLHLLDRWQAATVLRLVAEHHMPSIGGVAPQLALLLREPDFDDYDLTAVKTIVMGGALSPPALVREARTRIGAAYSIRYSSTESGGIGTATAFDAPDDEALYTVGRPRPGVQVEVRDDDHVLPPGEVGELWLRSPTQLSRYWNEPDATSGALVDGWVRTGDLGWFDPAGCLHLGGRKREMFIRGGYNVYPLEVDEAMG